MTVIKRYIAQKRGLKMNIREDIQKLVKYGLITGLIEQTDRIYTTNRLLELFSLEDPGDTSKEPEMTVDGLEAVLGDMLDYAFQNGIIDDNGIATRDLFDTKIMGVLVPRPSEVQAVFNTCYMESPQAATDFFYKFSQDTDYIRRYRICRDVKWVTKTQYGDLDITINLSKPEKDPKAIAAAGRAAKSGYPACLLCRENEGYAGRLDHPARQNHRIIPVTIQNSQWGFQYSPYVYYNEHCIVFN